MPPPLLRPLVLATGFGPFPGMPDNPSARLVGALPARVAGLTLVRAVLATRHGAGDTVAGLVKRHRPDLVVHFGVAGGATAIRVERMARNRTLPGAADADGILPGRAILRAGPPVRRTTLPVGALAARLRQAGVPAAASDDAGRYICNATLYASLAATDQGGPPALFIHVPPDGAMDDQQRLRGAVTVIRGIAGFLRAVGEVAGAACRQRQSDRKVDRKQRFQS